MAKIKLFIAISIDGYISKINGDLDWIVDFPNPQKNDYGYQNFYNSIGSVIMGSQAYYNIIGMDVDWPYKDKDCYVICRSKLIKNQHIKLLTQNIIEEVESLKLQSSKDIWLVGDEQVISLLLENKLINEMIITTIPILLGTGVPLFTQTFSTSNWITRSIKRFDNCITQIVYKQK